MQSLEFWGEQKIELQNMMENKRSPCSLDQGSLTCLASKRHKADLSSSPKENKVKVGERITALQQLVSPYGKTDTASVLLEAMEYIRFLHEQVKVDLDHSFDLINLYTVITSMLPEAALALSAPYLLQNTPPDQMQRQMQELEQYNSLRSWGLCVVPVSCTAGITGSNGADIWAPIKTTSKSD